MCFNDCTTLFRHSCKTFYLKNACLTNKIQLDICALGPCFHSLHSSIKPPLFPPSFHDLTFLQTSNKNSTFNFLSNIRILEFLNNFYIDNLSYVYYVPYKPYHNFMSFLYLLNEIHSFLFLCDVCNEVYEHM